MKFPRCAELSLIRMGAGQRLACVLPVGLLLGALVAWALGAP